MAGGAWALTEPVKSQHKAYLLAHNKTLNLQHHNELRTPFKLIELFDLGF
jgi:excinuclease UvrABC helicase subunit UvrB